MKKALFLFSFLICATANAADIPDLTFVGNYQIVNGGGTVNFQNFTINSGGGTIDAYALLYQMPRADTLTSICFRYNLRTGTPVAHRVSVQGVSTTALGPDGTILGGGSPASGAFTPPASAAWDGTGQCVTLTNSISVTRGQFVAFVIEPTGTPDGSNNGSFTTHVGNLTLRRFFPVGVTKTDGGSWSRVDGMPVVWAKSASATYGFPIEGISEPATSSDSNPDEYANTFTLPAAACDTFNVTGVECMFNTVGNAAKNFTYSLYSGTTALAAVTVDSDRYGAGGDGYRTLRFLFDDTPTALTCGTTYRIAVSSDSTSANFNPIIFLLDAAGDRTAYVGSTNMSLSSRVDAGSWTDTTTSLLLCSPIISDITEPAGGGGVQVPRAMTGGFMR